MASPYSSLPQGYNLLRLPWMHGTSMGIMLVGRASNVAAALMALLCLVLATGAQAQRWGHQSHSRVVIGVGFGWPYWSYWHYPPPYYYPRVVVQPEPVIYIEKGDPETAAAQDATYYWYFCRDSNTYYPYVKQCASPWQRVVPPPPPG